MKALLCVFAFAVCQTFAASISLPLNGGPVTVQGESSYSFQVDSPSEVQPYERIQFSAWLPSNYTRNQSIGVLTINEFPQQTVGCTFDKKPLDGLCVIWTPVTKLTPSTSYTLSISSADGSEFSVQAFLIGPAPLQVESNLFDPYEVEVSNAVGNYTFITYKFPPQSIPKLIQVSFLQDSVPDPYGPVQFFLAQNSTSTTLTYPGRTIDGMQNTYDDIATYGQSVQAECDSVCNWQYYGGEFTLSITSAIIDRKDYLAPPPEYQSWSVIVQLSLLDVPVPQEYGVGQEPFTGNVTTATGIIQVNIDFVSVTISYFTYYELYLSTLEIPFDPSIAWNVVVSIIPSDQTPDPPLPLLYGTTGNSSALQSYGPGLPGPYNMCMQAASRLYVVPSDDPTTTTAMISPCLIQEGEAVLLGVFGRTGPTAGAIQNTTLFSLTIDQTSVVRSVISCPTSSSGYVIDDSLNSRKGPSYEIYELEFPSSNSFTLYNVQVVPDPSSSFYYELATIPFLPTDSEFYCGEAISGSFTSEFGGNSWCFSFSNPLEPSALFLSVSCARCQISQPINAVVVVTELDSLIVDTPGTSNISIPTANNTQVPIVYQLAGNELPSSLNMTVVIDANNDSDWSVYYQLGSIASGGDCLYSSKCTLDQSQTECTLDLNQSDIDNIRRNYPKDVEEWGIIGLLTYSSSTPSNTGLTAEISVSVTN